MYKVGLLERTANFFAHKASLALVTSFALTSFSTPLSHQAEQTLETTNFNIQFSEFSPAFAAFEDEFLFIDDKVESFNLQSGLKKATPTLKFPKVLQVPQTTTPVYASKPPLSIDFDGSIALNNIEEHQPLSKNKLVKKWAQPVAHKKTLPEEELHYGSLFAMVGTGKAITKKSMVRPGPKAQKSPNNPNIKTPDVTVNPNHYEKDPLPEFMRVSGEIKLKDGLAFLGSIEVSWVVGDYELQQGSINTPDATYEIEVKELIGDIILSLYDNHDELIGEGLVDLTQARVINGQIHANIEVSPINWDTAGKIIDVSSVGQNYGNGPRLVQGANVELYAFNESTKSNISGEFGFYHWKKSNSRTLAIASKEGYKESVFTLDSRNEASVIMLSDSYANSFFKFIQQLGIYDVTDLGTVYGHIQGTEASGYSVRLEKAKPIYFMNSGFAQINKKTTNSNGLFAFVGLSDGDYELTVEKDGEIVDHKVVVVEQGKISPVIVNLQKIKKHIQYYNPMNPTDSLNSVDLSFFDGITTQSLDEHNSLSTNVTKGSGSSLLDYSGGGEVTRTFVSRNKSLQRLPLLQDDILTKLAAKNDLIISDGLVIGFIETSENYQVFLKESLVKRTLYFNELGTLVDPEKEVAYGFMIGGFPKGLNSLLIESTEDQMVLATDLVFSDHQTISIINTAITTVE